MGLTAVGSSSSAIDIRRGLTVELSEKADPAQPHLFSLSATFGRVLVTERVPSSDRAVWEEGLRDAANDHRYYEITHAALQDQFEHHYIVLKDPTGATRAVQPFFLVNQDIVMGMSDLITRAVEKIRTTFPSALKLRTLMVGCSAGEGDLVRSPGLDDRHWVARALGEVLPRIAARFGAELVVFKDFPKEERPRLEHLGRFGFYRIPSMPATKLELNYRDFDHYLETALSAKMRKDLRRKFRKAASGPPITMEMVRDITPFIDEAFPLYESVVAKSKLKFEVLTRDYFAALGQRMSDKAFFLIWRQNGRLVAFSSCFEHNGILRDNYVGFDYSVAHDYHLYFVSRRDMFDWAMARGLHTYHSAPLNYDPKLHLRQKLAPLDIYARATRDWLNPLFGRVLPLMEPTRSDPLIRKFANADELA